jgi:hypothetical protein
MRRKSPMQAKAKKAGQARAHARREQKEQEGTQRPGCPISFRLSIFNSQYWSMFVFPLAFLQKFGCYSSHYCLGTAQVARWAS